jgi:hypothetical protein
MAGSQKRLLNIIHEGKYILQDLKADGISKMPEQDVTDQVHEARGGRRSCCSMFLHVCAMIRPVCSAG